MISRAALGYDKAALIQQVVGEHLLSRLPSDLSPTWILDLGAGTGLFSDKVKAACYPEATYCLLDLSYAMLQETKKKPALCSDRVFLLCADAAELPLRSASVDILVSNLLLQWLPLDTAIYLAFKQVLKPGGLFLFSSLGPQTLRELRASFQAVDAQAHVHTFLDMHDYGDHLQALGFSDIVMQSETLILRYEHPLLLCRDLQAQGATYSPGLSPKQGMMGVRHFRRMLTAYQEAFQDQEGYCPATYEVIYGYAKVPYASQAEWVPQLYEVSIPVQSVWR